jgi:hypothetical protein
MALWYASQFTYVPSHRIVGHIPELLLSEEYGDHEFHWQEKYGQVYPIQGCFGGSFALTSSPHFYVYLIFQESRLVISDPSTIKYIMSSGVFILGPSHGKVANALFGCGNVFMARGTVHNQTVCVVLTTARWGPSAPAQQNEPEFLIQ